MPGRPGWHDEYWDQMDKATAKKIRSTCPRCGSSNTYYNKQYGTWRCGKCEHTFVIQGFDDNKSWWKKLFKR
jgi:ribosomal protein S27AE